MGDLLTAGGHWPTRVGRSVLTVEEACAFRDAATADELEAAARQARARWVAEALEDAANEWGPGVLDDSGRPIAATLRELAGDYRDGRR